MKTVNVTNINWDTDGEEVDLPNEVSFSYEDLQLDEDEEDIDCSSEIADVLSDKYGFCVWSFNYELVL